MYDCYKSFYLKHVFYVLYKVHNNVLMLHLHVFRQQLNQLDACGILNSECIILLFCLTRAILGECK